MYIHIYSYIYTHTHTHIYISGMTLLNLAGDLPTLRAALALDGADVNAAGGPPCSRRLCALFLAADSCARLGCARLFSAGARGVLEHMAYCSRCTALHRAAFTGEKLYKIFFHSMVYKIILSLHCFLALVYCILAFTRYCFTSKLYCGSQSSFYCPPQLRSLPYCNTIARLLRNKRPPPPTPPVYSIHHTILVMAIYCKGQIAHGLLFALHRPPPRGIHR